MFIKIMLHKVVEALQRLITGAQITSQHYTVTADRKQTLKPHNEARGGIRQKKRLQTCRQFKKTTVYILKKNPRNSRLCASEQVAHTAAESLTSPAAAVKIDKLLGESLTNELRIPSLCGDVIWTRIH